jgi:hypothetical protein
MFKLSQFPERSFAGSQPVARGLSEGGGELYPLPYAEIRCPRDACEVYRPFHKGCSQRRILSELSYETKLRFAARCAKPLLGWGLP